MKLDSIPPKEDYKMYKAKIDEAKVKMEKTVAAAGAHICLRAEKFNDRRHGIEHIYACKRNGHGKRQCTPLLIVQKDHKCKQIGKRQGNGCQNGAAGIFCRSEIPGEGLHQLNNEIANQNDGSRLHDVRPSALTHRKKCLPYIGNLIFRKLDDKEGFLSLVSRELIDQQGAQQNDGNTDEVHTNTHPTALTEESTGKQ